MSLKAAEFVDLFERLGASTYEEIPTLLELARDEHKRDFPENKDFEQSWRSVKGRGLENVIEFILARQLDELGMKLVGLKDVKNLLQIDYGEYGVHPPDVDLVVVQKSIRKVLAILSIKTSLRERATQTAYWRNKLRQNENTRHIKVFFVTPNSDDILRSNRKPNKQRGILETDIDMTYIVNLPGVTIDDYLYEGKSSRIRLIEQLADDLLGLI